MFKMIVVDLDGTILNNEKKLSKDTKKYLKMLMFRYHQQFAHL